MFHQPTISLAISLPPLPPNTSGIPYFKNGQNRSLEITKQLYDVGRLFDAATDLDCIKTAYHRIVPVEMSYRSLPIDAVLALDDTIATAKCLATRGKAGKGNFEALQNGINRLKSFMYLGKYYIEQASADAVKVRYLIEKKGIKPEQILVISFTNKAVGPLKYF